MDNKASAKSNYYITLLRHGESQGNFEGRHQGQADFPLTDIGRQQANALVERWRSENKVFDLIISSPLLRARETAELISASLNAPLELDPLWMERDNGMLTGLRSEEAREIVPQPDFVHPYQPYGQTGESLWEVYLRAGKAAQNLINRLPGCFLVVSHGGLLNMFLYAILGIAPQPNFHGPRFRFANSAFATVQYNPRSHNWYILGVNDHSHWKPEGE
jgi:2,3-bisphosphoglycerate-dependent phosphoglycerate mutase